MIDSRTDWFAPARAWMQAANLPVFQLSHLPSQAFHWFNERMTGNEQLRLDNARLHTENLILQGKVQKLNALTIENIRLRELLNSSRTAEENLSIAEIIAVSPDPFRHFVIVNRGSKQGVFVGQAVVDSEGVFGQVSEVTQTTSKIIQISDIKHGIPVQVDRNGVRLVVEGTGDFLRMQIPFVTTTTDLVRGDVLSTSGLDGVFPPNYPVARVVKVEHIVGQPFADVYAEPFAQLSRTRHVLLLFNKVSDDEK